MVFWRTRSEKKAEAPVASQAETPPPITAQPGSAAIGEDTAETIEASTNVVTLVTTRLADRLADRSLAYSIPSKSCKTQGVQGRTIERKNSVALLSGL